MNDWSTILTVIATGCTIIGSIYGLIRWIVWVENKKFKEMNQRFEMLDNRIFQLAMGKSLKEIMKEEKEKEGND